MENLIAILRRSGFIVLIGVFFIIYIALGIAYFQQGAKQKELGGQVDQISVVVSRPLPSAQKLEAEYDEVNRSLSPLAVPDVLDIIVGIAEESGIDVSPASGKLNIPPPLPPEEKKMGEGKYQVSPLRNIKAQGDYDSVMAFIADLDSGKTLKTLVLKSVDISQTEVTYAGEEGARRAEFRDVASAVIDMMTDNDIIEISNPIDYAGGTAVNFMGDDPETEETMEGFPDTTITAVAKGYTGTGTPKNGYVLYEHDRIDPDDTTKYTTVSYVFKLEAGFKTAYYYTCEADGTVRQFDGPNVAIATEYLGSAATKMETVATLDITLYTKSPESKEPPKK